MSLDWVATIATASVGIIGIAGTVYAVRLQRITQLESVKQQKSLEAEASSKIQKQVAFVDFWNAHQAFRHVLRITSSDTLSDETPPEVSDAYSRLFSARNNVALLASLYTMYYMDQIMGDAQRMIETPNGENFVEKFPDAPHYTYYLMRAELSGEDFSSRNTEDVLNALRDNSRRQREIHETLQGHSLVSSS